MANEQEKNVKTKREFSAEGAAFLNAKTIAEQKKEKQQALKETQENLSDINAIIAEKKKQIEKEKKKALKNTKEEIANINQQILDTKLEAAEKARLEEEKKRLEEEEKERIRLEAEKEAEEIAKATAAERAEVEEAQAAAAAAIAAMAEEAENLKVDQEAEEANKKAIEEKTRQFLGSSKSISSSGKQIEKNAASEKVKEVKDQIASEKKPKDKRIEFGEYKPKFYETFKFKMAMLAGFVTVAIIATVIIIAILSYSPPKPKKLTFTLSDVVKETGQKNVYYTDGLVKFSIMPKLNETYKGSDRRVGVHTSPSGVVDALGPVESGEALEVLIRKGVDENGNAYVYGGKVTITLYASGDPDNVKQSFDLIVDTEVTRVLFNEERLFSENENDRIYEVGDPLSAQATPGPSGAISFGAGLTKGITYVLLNAAGTQALSEQIATVHPQTGEIHMYAKGQFIIEARADKWLPFKGDHTLTKQRSELIEIIDVPFVGQPGFQSNTLTVYWRGNTEFSINPIMISSFAPERARYRLENQAEMRFYDEDMPGLTSRMHGGKLYVFDIGEENFTTNYYVTVERIIRSDQYMLFNFYVKEKKLNLDNQPEFFFRLWFDDDHWHKFHFKVEVGERAEIKFPQNASYQSLFYTSSVSGTPVNYFQKDQLNIMSHVSVEPMFPYTQQTMEFQVTDVRFYVLNYKEDVNLRGIIETDAYGRIPKIDGQNRIIPRRPGQVTLAGYFEKTGVTADDDYDFIVGNTYLNGSKFITIDVLPITLPKTESSDPDADIYADIVLTDVSQTHKLMADSAEVWVPIRYSDALPGEKSFINRVNFPSSMISGITGTNAFYSYNDLADDYGVVSYHGAALNSVGLDYEVFDVYIKGNSDPQRIEARLEMLDNVEYAVFLPLSEGWKDGMDIIVELQGPFSTNARIEFRIAIEPSATIVLEDTIFDFIYDGSTYTPFNIADILHIEFINPSLTIANICFIVIDGDEASFDFPQNGIITDITTELQPVEQTGELRIKAVFVIQGVIFEYFASELITIRINPT